MLVLNPREPYFLQRNGTNHGQVSASQKRMERQKEEADRLGKSWYDRAQLALQSGDEELAREALSRRQQQASSYPCRCCGRCRFRCFAVVCCCHYLSLFFLNVILAVVAVVAFVVVVITVDVCLFSLLLLIFVVVAVFVVLVVLFSY